MSASRKIVLGVIFGGRSVEHDVSVVTGHQVMEACDPARYQVVPIYIDRDGRWFTGEALRDLKTYEGDVPAQKGVTSVILSPDVRQHGLIVDPLPKGFRARSSVLRLDAVFPALHGSHGEDGTIQGLCELADVPYAGCGVLGSAVANDKWLSKRLLKEAGVPVLPALAFSRQEWEAHTDAHVVAVADALGFPVFVKPATLGSSIGIGKADTPEQLKLYATVALNFDRNIVIERAAVGCVEINCAVLGDSRELRASVLEQPISWDQFLTYEEKYLRGGDGMKSADRLIPAPISPELTAAIQGTAMQAFRAIDGRGTARIDFLLNPGDGMFYLNEINTMPGSLALYLWRETGLGAGAVIDRLVEVAQDARADKRRSTYNYETNLIALASQRGAKGAKGVKGAVRG